MKVGTNTKKFLLYFCYTIAVIIIGVAWNWRLMILKKQMLESFSINHWILLSHILYPILIGALLSFPSFFIQLRKTGKWKIDWAQLIGVGLPTLIVALIPFIYYDLYYYLPRGAIKIARHLGIAGTLQIICGTVFGYLLLAVFHKEIKDNTPKDGSLSPGG